MRLKEKWKDVPRYEGIYLVSNFGNVKSLRFGKEKILTPGISKGYAHVTLYQNGDKRGFKIHKLVMMGFNGYEYNKDIDLWIDHIDNDKLNNRLDNLQLITHRENKSKDVKSFSKLLGAIWHIRNKKWMARIRINGDAVHLGYYKTDVMASRIYYYAVKNIESYQGNRFKFIKLVRDGCD